MATDYPADSLQTYIGEWWQETSQNVPARGRLVRAFIPHVDVVPNRLVPEARAEATNHSRATFRIEPFRVSDPAPKSRLPIAALPQFPGEQYLVSRGKLRPAVIVGLGGVALPKSLKGGTSANWPTSPTLLVAPYYGTEASQSRSGWKPELVSRIRRAEFPQYLWDKLPLAGADESILRLDHVQPIGRHQDSVELTKYTLSPNALSVLDEYMSWCMTGLLDKSGDVYDIRQELMSVFKAP